VHQTPPAAQETPEVDDLTYGFSAGINVHSKWRLSVFERTPNADVIKTVLYPFFIRYGAKVLRGGGVDLGVSQISASQSCGAATQKFPPQKEGEEPSAILQNDTFEILPPCIAVGHEMSLRVAALLASLFIFSAFVVAQINAPNCNSTSWQWVCIL
jgi:hypothetical protein